MSIIYYQAHCSKALKCCISLMVLICAGLSVNAQCTLTDAACTGTEMASSGAVTIPSGTTYIISAGNTSSATVTFTNATSKLCIEGTFTGKPAGGTAGGGTIDVYGTVTNATTWSFNGGGMILNIHIGGVLTIDAFSVSGGTYSITNCGDMTFTAATGINATGGTFTINNYASINVNGTLFSNNSGFTFNNRPGSQLYVGNNFTFSAGSFINNAKMCVTATSSFSGGTFTNNDCFRTTSYSISGSGAFTNNNYLYVNGNFSNSGTNNSNNGTLEISGNYSGSGDFNVGAGSLLTSVGWSCSGILNGPGSGCAQIRATGATSLSGTISAGNSSRVYFYDSGTPAAGWDSKTGNSNSTNINNNSCTPTSFPACSMAGSACTTVLPIVLAEFNADCKNGKMEISWTTASETSNDYFTIERTLDGSTYDAIGVVDSKAPGGTSIQPLHYNFVDHSFPKEEAANLNKLFYYRLKQTDFDGSYTHSSIQAASCSPYCISDITIAGSTNELFLTIPSICSTFADFSIYNALGQIVFTKREYIETGNNIIRFNANDMAAGLYIVKASTHNQTFQKKFGKQ